MLYYLYFVALFQLVAFEVNDSVRRALKPGARVV